MTGGRAADLLAAALLLLLLIPVAALVGSGSPAELVDGLRSPLVVPALILSGWTSVVSLMLIVLTGTPLAWRLARSEGSWARLVGPLVELPIVLPPAVVGVALLLAFGRRGPLATSIPFTTTAVVVAQVVVAAPFYVRAATAAFKRVDDDLLLVARTLGASPARAFFAVAVPAALPGLFAGAALAWARALGEFGATLLFAGNLPGRTQTMPLAIFSALESDLGVARALSVLLAGVALAVLISLRVVPRLIGRRA